VTIRLAAAIFVLAGTPALAHRLDEYLQGSIVSVEKNRLTVEMTLTPGVIVFPALISDIDTDGDGAISEREQRAYGERVLRDISLTIDGDRLAPRLLSLRFPTLDDMKEGRGEIHLDFSADLPPGGRHRKVTIENRHQSRVAAYQVNCLVPRDPHIRIAAQNRNYSQSLYQLEYEQTDVRSDSPFWRLWSGGLGLASPAALLLLMRLAVLRRRRAWPAKASATLAGSQTG
jgi:hypothetical protein